MYGGALKRVDEQPDAGAAEVIHGPQVQGDRAAGVEVVQQRTAQPGGRVQVEFAAQFQSPPASRLLVHVQLGRYRRRGVRLHLASRRRRADRRFGIGGWRGQAEADFGTGGGGLDNNIDTDFADDYQAAPAVKIVGAFGTPAAEVTHLDLDRPVAAEGDQVGELARFPGAGIGVLNGVGGGFAQGDLQIFTERGGQRTRPYPTAPPAGPPGQRPP